MQNNHIFISIPKFRIDAHHVDHLMVAPRCPHLPSSKNFSRCRNRNLRSVSNYFPRPSSLADATLAINDTPSGAHMLISRGDNFLALYSAMHNDTRIKWISLYLSACLLFIVGKIDGIINIVTVYLGGSQERLISRRLFFIM
jgi:hypothetical protein